uniref:50S ribosomal protein L35 n=1 Tax=Amphimedon queenslandica TaxID=400682 RepID=A0A1X7VMS3_AMPQE
MRGVVEITDLSMASTLFKQWLNPVIAYWRVGSSITDQYLPLVSQTRSIVRFSKKGKKKTVKAVAKRFMRTGSGMLKYWRPGKNHKMMAKSHKASRQMRKHCYVNKTQLKLLNKMISGW